ncbi:MAG: hypothetical protein SAMD01599839_11390 [Rectinema sp.]
MPIKKVKRFFSSEFTATNRALAVAAFSVLALLLAGYQTPPVQSNQSNIVQQAIPPSPTDQENDSSMVEEPSSLDPVRWWDQGKQSPIRELVIETPEQLAARVPKRADPKIVILMYHNIVFGRKGGEYNHDLYNFEHDFVFLRNRTQIIGIDDLPYIKSGEKKLDTGASISIIFPHSICQMSVRTFLLSRFTLCWGDRGGHSFPLCPLIIHYCLVAMEGFSLIYTYVGGTWDPRKRSRCRFCLRR